MVIAPMDLVKKNILIAVDFTDDKIYWYVQTSGMSKEWSGNDGEFCINPTDAFDLNSSAGCASSK